MEVIQPNYQNQITTMIRQVRNEFCVVRCEFSDEGWDMMRSIIPHNRNNLLKFFNQLTMSTIHGGIELAICVGVIYLAAKNYPNCQGYTDIIAEVLEEIRFFDEMPDLKSGLKFAYERIRFIIMEGYQEDFDLYRLTNIMKEQIERVPTSACVDTEIMQTFIKISRAECVDRITRRECEKIMDIGNHGEVVAQL